MTEGTERHCGYANYETFTIAVVVDNDQQLYKESRAMVAQSQSEREYAFEVADDVRAWVEARFITPVTEDGATHHGIAATLVNSALGEVDWAELVEEWTKEEGQ